MSKFENPFFLIFFFKITKEIVVKRVVECGTFHDDGVVNELKIIINHALIKRRHITPLRLHYGYTKQKKIDDKVQIN